MSHARWIYLRFLQWVLKKSKGLNWAWISRHNKFNKTSWNYIFIEERAMDIRKKTRAFFSFLTAVIDWCQKRQSLRTANSKHVSLSSCTPLSNGIFSAVFAFSIPVNLLPQKNSCHFFKLTDIYKTKGKIILCVCWVQHKHNKYWALNGL